MHVLKLKLLILPEIIHTVLIKRLDILEIFSGHLASEHIELSKQLDKKG